ncbi:MAG: COX15/CtaA family protein [Planctomycetes bacterium]|nr:COX15/CtaA family protein [Planctomycetota bacterium]
MASSASTPSAVPAPSPWPRRLIVAAGLVLLPLFAFGGSVTTLGAGMAVTGWWNAEGSFMPFFPIDKWFRDLGTFVEHSHRQFGLVLGLLMIAAVVATWLRDPRPSARWLVAGALAAIGLQGWIGGSRVLENSPGLAFLHGTFSQFVIAVMAAAWVHQSAAWRASASLPFTQSARLRRLAILTTVIVFVQIGLGAWYRHALRTGLEGNLHMRIGIHMLGAIAVLGHVLPLAKRLRAAATEAPASPFASLAKGLTLLVVAQLVLGLVAWMIARPEDVDFFQWLVATAHVLGGALLLAWCVAAAMWASRTVPSNVVVAGVR